MQKQLVTITDQSGISREVWLTDREVDRLVAWLEANVKAPVGMLTLKGGK